jgi:hypothetical protein
MEAAMSAPSFCWQCGGRLQYGFATVIDCLGHEHPVHKVCEAAAVLAASPQLRWPIHQPRFDMGPH